MLETSVPHPQVLNRNMPEGKLQYGVLLVILQIHVEINLSTTR